MSSSGGTTGGQYAVTGGTLLLSPGSERDPWVGRVGSVLGIELFVHYLLPAVIVLEILNYSVAGGGAGAVLGLMIGLTLFATVLVHELGHAKMASHVGGSCEKITLWPLGGLAMCATPTGDHGAAVKVALAGPATHLPLGLLFWLLQLSCGDLSGPSPYLHDLKDFDRLWCNYTSAVCWMNIQLLIFNMLPAYPLDGGRVLASALLFNGKSSNDAARITCFVAAPIGSAVLGVGIYQMLGSFSGGILTILVGAWMLMQVWTVWQLQAQGRAEHHPLFMTTTTAQGQAGNV